MNEFRAYSEGDSFKFITNKEEKRFKDTVNSLKYKTKKRTDFKLKLSRYCPGRTSKQAHENSNQNGYLWGVVIQTLILSDPFIGYSPADMELGLRCHFMRIGGSDAFPKTKPFQELKKMEWEEKMEEIRTWALTEYQIKIQTVGEYYWGEDEQKYE